MITDISKGTFYRQVNLRPEEGYGLSAETREDGAVDVEEVQLGKVTTSMAERIRTGESSLLVDHITPHPCVAARYMVSSSDVLNPTVRYRNPGGQGEVITSPTSLSEFKLA